MTAARTDEPFGDRDDERDDQGRTESAPDPVATTEDQAANMDNEGDIPK
ncbi:hypothetical protein [Nocardia jejuensis]|nr:hypothetical protein [Nocardia jejuensis]